MSNMPYKRRRNYRRRKPVARKRRYKRFVKRVKAIANKAGEKKFFATTSGGFQGIDWTGTITSISDVSQGDTDVTRDGDQIYIRSLEMSWEVAVGDTYNIVRLIVLQWFPATTPTISDILLTSGNNDSVLSPYSHDTRFQFKVLYDRKIHVNTDRPNMSLRFRIWRNFRFRRIQYIGGGTTGQNKIYILKISDSGAVPNPTMANFAKMNFSDN